MTTHTWKMACKNKLHSADVVPGPFNGIGADFLIHGVTKPRNASPGAVDNAGAGVSVSEELAGDEEFAGLNVEILNMMLQRQIPTTVSIPSHCSSSEERSGTRKKLQTAAINKALLVWREPAGCISLVQQLLGLNKRASTQRAPSKKKTKRHLEACRKKLSYGHYTAAIRILSSSGVAQPTADTLFELQQKHPYVPPPTISTEAVSTPSLTVDSKAVLAALKSFPKGTSCGRDGLRAQHLLDAMSGAGAAISDELLLSITGVVNLWLAGKCPPSIGIFVASAPLTPLLKPGGGLRPIAVGTIWRRLCSKLASTSVCKNLNIYLGNHQYGVGIPCGGESILYAANRFLEMHGSDNTKSMLLIDFSNAFNMVDRSTIIREVRTHCPIISRWVEFCYMQPARLYYQEHLLSSTQGVQQGDLLGPLLFALALHPLIEKIASTCMLDFHAWYLDDGTIAGDTMEVSKALKILQEDGPVYGLHLNISKTELFWPSYDPRRDSDTAFPANIGLTKPLSSLTRFKSCRILSVNFCFCATVLEFRGYIFPYVLLAPMRFRMLPRALMIILCSIFVIL
ncbi:uncharacterized protein LOC113357059 isoform X2 [Papaver somniferum]|uniref:uncharacterized protein LOC113357059 isoform X2 n=1 Tax=Papaver somniferum TaxID=3469 RepID=UPI000E6FA253|nr:uncharacterized protein LOC113357059 isoform X2 [Papaver somniferum]